MKLCNKIFTFVVVMIMLVGCAKSPISENLSENVTDAVSVEDNSEQYSETETDIAGLQTEATVEDDTTEITTDEPISEITTEQIITQESTTEESTTQEFTTLESIEKESTTQEITTENNTGGSKNNGKGLAVKGSKLVDSSGKVVKLRGISTHGLSWYPQYVNKDTFKYMRDEWKVNTIRLAMYTAEYNGYCTGDDNNRQVLMNLIDNGVSYATELGMYVIIDWHILSDGNPNTYKNQSIEFFNIVSKKYSKNNNVIYEICNEPNGGTSWEDIKSYAIDVIDTIRKNDKDAVIIVGTPNWSQYVDQAVASPINRKNLLYALHFYADTHRDDLRNKMVNAINSGLPIIVSEFGICDASGNVNTEEADKWMKVMEQNSVSYVIWNLSNKQESSALISSSCNKLSGWSRDELSESGKWFVSK